MRLLENRFARQLCMFKVIWVIYFGFYIDYLCTCRVRGLNVGRDLENIDPSEVLGQV